MFAKNSGFEAVMDFKVEIFPHNNPIDPKIMTFPIKWLKGYLMWGPWSSNMPIEDILDETSRQSRPQTTQSSQIPIKKQVSKNDFFIDIFENLDLGSEMYISEISKSKISDYKAQKMTIL